MSRDAAGRELVAGMTIVAFGAQVFSAHLPSYYDIRKPPALTGAEKAVVERGILIAAGITAGFGTIVSWLMRDSLPAVFGIVAALGFAAVYTLGIRGDQRHNRNPEPAAYTIRS